MNLIMLQVRKQGIRFLGQENILALISTFGKPTQGRD